MIKDLEYVNKFKRCSNITLDPEFPHTFLIAGIFQNIKLLDISNTNIKYVDFSTCSNLTHLTCSNSQLKILDVFQHPSLKSIIAKDMPQLHFACVQYCDKLQQIKISSLVSYSLDLTHCETIKDVDASDSALIDINVQSCYLLRVLNISNTKIHSLDLLDCKRVQEIYCQNTPLRIFKIKTLKKLKKIDLRNTNIHDSCSLQ